MIAAADGRIATNGNGGRLRLHSVEGSHRHLRSDIQLAVSFAMFVDIRGPEGFALGVLKARRRFIDRAGENVSDGTACPPPGRLATI